MRILRLAVIVGACAVGTSVSAQDNPAPTPSAKPTYTAEAMRNRVRRAVPTTPVLPPTVLDALNCVLPDKTERAVNTIVTVNGRSYRCVEVLDQNFNRRGVAWPPVDPLP